MITNSNTFCTWLGLESQKETLRRTNVDPKAVQKQLARKEELKQLTLKTHAKLMVLPAQAVRGPWRRGGAAHDGGRAVLPEGAVPLALPRVHQREQR